MHLTFKSPDTILYITMVALLQRMSFAEAGVTLDYVERKIDRVASEILTRMGAQQQAGHTLQQHVTAY